MPDINQPLATPVYSPSSTLYNPFYIPRTDGTYSTTDWDGQHHYSANGEEYLPLQMVNDSQVDEISNLANQLNIKLTPETKDYLTQYYLNDLASINSYKRELQARDTQYQAAVADLQKAGINPAQALGALGGSMVNSSSGSVSGSNYTSRANQRSQDSTKAATSIMSILAIVATAMIRTL